MSRHVVTSSASSTTPAAPTILTPGAHPGIEARIVDAYGTPTSLPLDADAPPIVEIRAPTIEVEMMALRHKTKNWLGALAGLVQKPMPEWKATGFHKQCSSDLADGTVNLLRNGAANTLAVCMSVRETDKIRLDARKMLEEYVAAMKRVDVTRDSAPGIALARHWILCNFMLMHVRSSPAQRSRALIRWRDVRNEIMAKV